MIQNRRHSRKVNGSTKSNKTFDKHNGIKRVKDDEFDPRKFDLNALIKEELEFVDVNDPNRGLIAFLKEQNG